MRRYRRWDLYLALALLLVACSGPNQPTVTALPTPRGTVPPTPAVTLTIVPASTATATVAIPTINLPTATTPRVGGGAEDAGGWATAGTLATARGGHTATLLPDGRVLVVGGESNQTTGAGALNSAELYDLSANRWSATGSLNLGRHDHTATLLANGEVLVVGGDTTRSGSIAAISTNSADLFDPVANAWHSLANAATPRSHHTATLLPDGRILVVGGETNAANGTTRSLNSAEIYDPRTSAWGAIAPLNVARSDHTATVLPNGQVLVAGGEARNPDGSIDLSASAEIFDPATNTWSATGSLATGRQRHTATLLPNGKVLVAGGQTPDARGGRAIFAASGGAQRGPAQAAVAPAGSAELYDPQSKTWTPVGSLAAARVGHTATLLPNGQVLVIGGTSKAGDAPLASGERYDPGTNAWTTFAAPTARAGHTATLLPDGTLLVAGGQGGGNVYLDSAERYNPRTPVTPTPVPTIPPTATPVPTATVPPPPAAPTATPTRVPIAAPSPTATRTVVPLPVAPPTAPPTTAPPTAPPPTLTPTRVPPTLTPPPPPTLTPTRVPPTVTPTPVPPPPTPTRVPPPPPTSTPTRVPPTLTPTPRPPQTGTVFGVVRCCGSTGAPVAGATVTAGNLSATTDAGGNYSIAGVPAGQVTVAASYSSSAGFSGAQQSVTVPPGGRVQQNFNLPAVGQVPPGEPLAARLAP